MTNTCDEGAFRSIKDNLFRFRCHKGIACFTRCCRDLNLLLTPYDIIRLKNRMGISSEAFLEDYTETKLDERSRYPMVYLRMADDSERKCPFLSVDGCTIYEDRPTACRIYPLGRAATRPDGKEKVVERFFLVTEKHCLGLEEDKEWTPDAWLENQGMREYNIINDPWMEIITSSKSLGQGKTLTRKLQMFFMASYNIDRFRDFLFGSKFFELFDLDSTPEERLKDDDKELVVFAFQWLRFSLFGEKTMHVKNPGNEEPALVKA